MRFGVDQRKSGSWAKEREMILLRSPKEILKTSATNSTARLAMRSTTGTRDRRRETTRTKEEIREGTSRSNAVALKVLKAAATTPKHLERTSKAKVATKEATPTRAKEPSQVQTPSSSSRKRSN